METTLSGSSGTSCAGSAASTMAPSGYFNLQGLLHLLQLPVLQLADPPGDGAVVTDGVLEPIAHHGPLPHRRKGQQFLENGGGSADTP